MLLVSVRENCVSTSYGTKAPKHAALSLRSAPATFLRYAACTPYALALFRAAELAPLAGCALPRPVVDLGCGDGLTVRCALRGSVELGVDRSAGKLRLARAWGSYDRLLRADAGDLPLESGGFGSALLVSVLEHLAEPQPVLQEAARVLRPGGLLVATIVLEDLHAYLARSQALRRRGWPRAARLYEHAHDFVFAHRKLEPAERWLERIAATGLTIEVARRVVGPVVTAEFDRALAAAWPYRLLRPLGVRGIARSRADLRRLLQRAAPLLAEENAADGVAGSCLLVVARRQ